MTISDSMVTLKMFHFYNDFFNTLNGLLVYGLKKSKFSVEEIKSWFEFETEELESEFYTEFDKLKEYECIDTEIVHNDANNVEGEIIVSRV